MDTTAYYAIGIPAYIALFVAEAAIARHRAHPAPSLAGAISNITVGLGAIVVGMAVGPAMVALYDWTYRHFALLDWSDIGWWPPWLIALVLGDLANYWRHRCEHRWSVLWAVHHVHHSPSEMNLSVGMRHAWLSDTYAFPFYFALPLLGIPPAQFFLAMVTVTLYALFTHSREYDYPSFGVLVTPRTHMVHHAINPRYVDKNFAAMFVVWDRWFGTYQPLDDREPLEFGSARGSETHCGALAQWVGFRELWRRARQTKTWRARLATLTARPHGDAVTPPPSELSRRAVIYVVIQLALVVAFSAYVFGLSGGHWPWAVAGSSLIVASIIGIGMVLDHRAAARWFEPVRCAVFVPGAAVVVAATTGAL